MPCARAAATSGAYSYAVLKAPKPALASHTPFFGDLAEVVAGERRLEDHRAGVHPHAARAVVLEALVRRDRERLHAVGIARPAGHVDLRGADRGGDAAMQVAFEIADGLLARREIAERDVHVQVDQPGDGGDAAGVDHDVAGFDRARRRGADRDDAVVLGDDGVAVGQRFG